MQIHSGIFGLGFKSNQVGQMTSKIWAMDADGIPTGDNVIEIGYLTTMLAMSNMVSKSPRCGNCHNAIDGNCTSYCEACITRMLGW
jgi:hypothetical protein